MKKAIIGCFFFIVLVTSSITQAQIESVDVEVGDVFEYQITKTILNMEHKGVSYTDDLTYDYEGKTLTLTVNAIYQEQYQDFFVYIDDRPRVNFTAEINDESYETYSYVNEWFDFTNSLQDLYYSYDDINLTDFQPSTPTFNQPMLTELFLALPIFTVTNYSYYEEIMDMALWTGNTSLSEKHNYFSHDKALHDKINGELPDYTKWTIETVLNQYIWIDITSGIVWELDYYYKLYVKIGTNITTIEMGQAFENNGPHPSETSSISNAIVFEVIALVATMSFLVKRKRG